MKDLESSWRRYRDYTLYVLIGTIAVGLAVWWGIHTADTDTSPNLPLHWLNFAGMTALVFGYTIRQFWKTRSVRLWMTWGVMLALHLGVSIPLIYALHPVPMAWITLALLSEQLVISEVIARFAIRDTEKRPVT